MSEKAICKDCARMSLAMTTGDRNWTQLLRERDRLAEINKVLIEALQTTLDRYEDMNGDFFDSESKRIRDAIAKAKEMGSLGTNNA